MPPPSQSNTTLPITQSPPSTKSSPLQFVHSERFRGTCYRAANWQRIGQTKGRADAGRSPKDVYVYPLAKRFRAVLLHGPRPVSRRRQPPPAQPQAPDADFVALWQDLIGALDAIAAEQDRRWQRRSRVLNTLLVMLFVFRLVFAPRRQGYTTTLSQLWSVHLFVPRWDSVG